HSRFSVPCPAFFIVLLGQGGPAMTPVSAKQQTAHFRARLDDSAWPFVSVVVPVRNEARVLGATLQQLLRPNYSPERFEVRVADGRATDGTRAIVCELQGSYPNLHLLDNPGRLSSGGRNVAIRAARGDLILIVDGHCEIEHDQHLRALASAFAESGAACVGRPQPLDIAT